ncbi:hypothetical protein B7P43_G00773 [Cryptotermes secundus]|nr:hypothetical protein B7P43_G00773 [Cryptotermes secundus]
MTPRRNKSPEESAKKGYSSFQRSLKLLGLQPEDFGINNKINISGSHAPSYRVGPTFHTRLTKRSSSLENLRSAALSHMADGQSTPGEHLDRRILSNAVYEEWYFQKLEEARRKKKAQELNDQKKEEHIEKVKAEQKQKAEENFNEWKLLKNKQRQQGKQQQGQKKLENKAAEDFRLTDGTKVRRNQEEVFLVWKKEKDKLLRQRKLKQKIQKETVKPDNDKNAAAEMTFNLWKKQADETLKEKAQEEKRRKQEEEEAKKEKERVKRESAEASFCAWKKKKDSELKKKMMEDR